MGPSAVPVPLRWVSFALALVAVGISGYLTYAHFAAGTVLACPDSGIVNCTLVTTSSWSRLFGVPVALLGLLWAMAMVTLCSPWAWRRPAFSLTRVVLASAGVATVLYLVYAELFGIGAICLWCTAMHVVVFALFVLALLARAAEAD